MKNLFTLIAVTAFTFVVNAQGIVNVNPDPNGEPWLAGGLRELTADDYSRIASTPALTMSEAQRSRNLPSMLDNSTLPWFRPVFSQEGGSCGQASGIGYNFTYEMDYLRGVSANTIQNQYPTHYTWNFLNGGQGGGSWYFDGWQIIAANGCPNVETYGGTPWAGGDQRWMSGYDQYVAGMSNRMLEVMTIDVSDEEGLLTLKQWMYDRLDGSPTGGLANFSAGVSDVFSMNYLPAGTPNAGKLVITGWGEVVNHAMTFVGYDDNIRYDFNNDGQYTNNLDITGDGTVDLRDWEIGGLIMVNSWGTTFGNGGKVYVMYRTLALNVSEGGIWNNLLHVIRTRTDYQPQLTLKTVVRHTSRDKIRIAAGVSPNTTDTRPAYMLEFPMFSNQGGNYYMQGGYTEEDKSLEMGLDITPLLSYLTPGQTSRFFFQVIEQDPDNIGNGQVTSLSLNVLDQSLEIQSNMSNVQLLNNDTTWVWTDAAIDFIPAQILTEELPAAHPGTPYSYQLEASGAPGPYQWSVIQNYTESTDQTAFPSVTSNQLIPNNNDDGFATRAIDFDFPFYGGFYNNLVITTDGSIAFGEQFEYIRSEAALKTTRAITAYGTDLMIYPEYGDAIFYQGDATHATFRWKISKFDNPSFDNDFAVTLYPDGRIVFHYGNGITPSSDWAAGISAGDGTNYLIAGISGSASIIPGSSYRFTCPPLPSGMSLSSDGIYSGIPGQDAGTWEVTFKATASNYLFSTVTLPFTVTESQLLVEPDTLIFEDDTQAYEGKFFMIKNITDTDVIITEFETTGMLVLQDGIWPWEAWFYDPLPRTVAPGEQIQVVVALVFPVMMQPLAGFAVDTLHFATTTENYEVLLMFNDTINIYSRTNLISGNEDKLWLSPNPATDRTTIEFPAQEAGTALLTIYNSGGNLIRREVLTGIHKGSNIRALQTSDLAKGLYMINVHTNTGSISGKLLIR